MLEDTYYFRLGNDSSGVVEKDVRVVQQRGNGKYYIISLSSQFEEEAGDCDLKWLLMGKEKRFSVLDSIKALPAQPTYVRKIQKVKDGFILRLSNKNIQFLLDDAKYLLTCDGKLWELVAGKEKEINVSKLIAGSALKGNKEHLKVIRQVVAEIDSRKGECTKENRPRWTFELFILSIFYNLLTSLAFFFLSINSNNEEAGWSRRITVVEQAIVVVFLQFLEGTVGLLEGVSA